MSNYIFDENDLKKDIEELNNLESHPNVESDSILYERLEYLKWKVDKARQYLMDYSSDIDWNLFDYEIKSTIKHIKNLNDKDKEYYICLLMDKIHEHGFTINKEDLLKYMNYIKYFKCVN